MAIISPLAFVWMIPERVGCFSGCRMEGAWGDRFFSTGSNEGGIIGC